MTVERSSGGPPTVRQVMRFGPYMVLGTLAEGGMAEILLAKQIGALFERDVVIKRMHGHLAGVAELVHMFLDEARLASKLQHPNIVQIVDLGKADERYYICMEYLPGEDLDALTRACASQDRQLPIAIAAHIALCACEALEYAHGFSDADGAAHVVHRDISPGNILVTYQGMVKVVDFGIAKAATKVNQTQPGTVKGKWGYMSPEQARGDVTDARSDLFSLGLTLHELLTGQRVFQKESELGVLLALLSEPVRSPRELRPEVPVELERVVLKATQRERSERYQSAAEMRADLDRWLDRGSRSQTASGLSQFMYELFGPEQVAFRTRIPTMRELSVLGLVKEPEPGAPPPKPEKPPPPSSPRPRTEVVSTAPPPPSSPSRLPAMALALGAAIVGAGAVWMLKPSPATAPQILPVMVAPPPPQPVVAPPPPVEEPAPVPAAPAKLPAALSPADMGAVIARSKRQLLQCFDQFRSALGAETGDVVLTLTILGSGAVSAAEVDLKGIESEGLSACITKQVKALKFPKSAKPSVTVAVPFSFRVGG